jgi:hypothetical protein
MEMAIIGSVSALAGYVVGLIFKVPTVCRENLIGRLFTRL